VGESLKHKAPTRIAQAGAQFSAWSVTLLDDDHPSPLDVVPRLEAVEEDARGEALASFPISRY
jgi:hypothetical protein